MDITAVWNELKEQIIKGDWPDRRIRPYSEIQRLHASFKNLMELLRTKVNDAELDSPPEMHRVGNRFHYVIPLVQFTERRKRKRFLHALVS